MDFLELVLQAIVSMIAVLTSYHILLTWTKRSISYKIKTRPTSKQPPEAGRSWPIIGHLHLLNGPESMDDKLFTMAHKHGPIFMLRLGMHPTLVVNGLEAIKECLTTNDRVLASRPYSALSEIVCYNYLMFGVAPFGPYWKEMRKTSVLHLLSNSRLEVLKHVRYGEIDKQMKLLYRLWVENGMLSPVKVEMKEWLNELTFNIVAKMVVGRRSCIVGESDRVRNMVKEFFRLLQVFVLSDMFPFLKWVDWKGNKRRMKTLHMDIDSAMSKFLEEHKRPKKKECEEEDYMDIMLSIMEVGSGRTLLGHDSDTVVKANCMGMIIAGTETTSTTLAGIICALLANPQVLKTAQDELDTHIGKHRQMKESDIKNLVYLQAIIKETLRIGPAGAILPLHEAMEDFNVGSFHVPAGTRVMMNVGSVHRDPDVWPDPLEFRPERWLDDIHKDIDMKGQHFEFIPFGSGRRSCPGISFALQVMGLTLGRLIHGFDIEIPADAPPVSLLVRSLRFDNPKPSPVEVLFKPRLPMEHYDQ